MEPILWLLETYSTPFWPVTIIGWLGWFVFLGIIVWLVWKQPRVQLPVMPVPAWLVFSGLILLVIISNLFIGIRLPVGSALPLPGIPQEPRGPAIMLFSVIPMLMGGVLFGPVAAGILGFLAGFLRFLLDTHSIYTPLELALLSILFSLAVRQRFRTNIFILLREPLITSLVLLLFYIPVFIMDGFFVSSGSMAARLDYALTGVGLQTLSVGSELLLAGVIIQILVTFFPTFGRRNLPLLPSPVERSLEARFMYGSGTLIILLLLTLLIGDWFVAGSAAREMLYNRLKGTAETASQSVPFFLETGQNLAARFAKNPILMNALGDDLTNALQEQIESVPYFDQLLVYDSSKTFLAGFSSPPHAQAILYPEEIAGLDLAVNGVLSQIYSIPPAIQDQGPARVSFIITMFDPTTAKAGRILIARTSLATNPFILPLITSLKSMSELGGSGLLLDENDRILYHPILTQVMNQYTGFQQTEPVFFDDTAPNGTRALVYYQPVTGRSWAVVLIVPAQQTQQLALSIAAPLFGMIIVLAVIALVSLRLSLKGVTLSMQTLAAETVRISQGQLDHGLALDGVDEVGQLRRSFEQMRVSLKAGLAELNRLLLVSQGVASSLDVHEAVQPVLDAVLATGADVVRIVLHPLVEETGQGQLTILTLGQNKDSYAQLDKIILSFAEQQERLFITDTTKTFGLGVGVVLPVSVFAILLRHENHSFGVLWAGYEHSYQFSDSDERFLTTLAGQAALAASNHHLFRTAEVGRQRLAAILASTPDPVLVIDQNSCLLLANPAAAQVLGQDVVFGKGKPIEKVIKDPGLLEILRAVPTDSLSIEVTLPDERIYLATASPVVSDNQPVGRVCILRDVTHFKELDLMKTEFVNTVSHDLRSPLTLMRGYATMLETIGPLNEQQMVYIKKIISGVESMAHLVNTLLDLGRVEAGVGLQLELVSIVDLIEQVTGPLQLVAVQKNIQLSVDIPRNIRPMMEADRALFQQVIYNLVENAIKYTPEGGQIVVKLQVLNDNLLLEIQDSGIGVDPKDKLRLFDKFYRGGQRQAREQKGTGLGLAIVKTITEHHSGKVWFESQLGKGSSFFLQVPLHQKAKEKE